MTNKEAAEIIEKAYVSEYPNPEVLEEALLAGAAALRKLDILEKWLERQIARCKLLPATNSAGYLDGFEMCLWQLRDNGIIDDEDVDEPGEEKNDSH